MVDPEAVLREEGHEEELGCGVEKEAFPKENGEEKCAICVFFKAFFGKKKRELNFEKKETCITTCIVVKLNLKTETRNRSNMPQQEPSKTTSHNH